MKTTTTKLTIIAAALLLSTTAHAAGTAINETGEMPDPSAILDARSETRGFLPPRMTAAQRGAISSPATGLQVYQTDGTAGLYVYNGAAWNLIGNATGTVSTANGGTGSTDGSITGSRTLTFTAGGTNQNVTLTPSGTGYTLLGGNVGIGTATPDTRLAVIEDASFNSINVRSGRAGGVVQRSFTTTLLEGSGANGGFHGNVALKFHHNENNNLSGDLSFWTKDDSNIQYERMRIAYNGNVGIGTTAPAAKLHVYGTQTGAAWAGMGAFGGASYAVILGQYNDKAYLGAHNAALNAWADLAINPGGGNVGIGTTTPNNKLQIGPTTYSVNSLAMGNGTQNFAIDISSRTIPTFFSDNNFSFMGSGGNGNVGIGTTTPAYKLHIQDATSPALAIQYSTNSDYPYLSSNASNDLVIGSVGSGSHSVFKSNGNVGIGTTTPGSKLHVESSVSNGYAAVIRNYNNTSSGYGLQVVAGSTTASYGAYLIDFFDATGATRLGSIAQSGSNTVAYNISSDRRLKDNIVDTHFSINDLMKIPVRDYTYKADAANTPTTGFIAQELYEIFPNAVTKPTNAEDMWSVDYGKVTPLLVKGIQDLKAENDGLKARLLKLEKALGL